MEGASLGADHAKEFSIRNSPLLAGQEERAQDAIDYAIEVSAGLWHSFILFSGNDR